MKLLLMIVIVIVIAIFIIITKSPGISLSTKISVRIDFIKKKNSNHSPVNEVFALQARYLCAHWLNNKNIFRKTRWLTARVASKAIVTDTVWKFNFFASTSMEENSSTGFHSFYRGFHVWQSAGFSWKSLLTSKLRGGEKKQPQFLISIRLTGLDTSA